MTEKELLYVEDAIGHEQNIIKICTETVNYLEDDNIKIFMQEEIDKHTDLKNNLTSLLEVHANE